MRLNHPDYIALVIEAYNKKRLNNELSPLLTQSTPGNIRRECANVYQERYEKKDGPILRGFFGPAEHGRHFLELIQGFEADRFRTLDKYLKGAPKKLNDRDLELLAWLIDFKHRPYSFDMKVNLSEDEIIFLKGNSENQAIPKPEDEELEREEEEAGSPLKNELETIQDKNEDKTMPPLANSLKDRRTKRKPKRVVIFFLILIICTGGMYAIWHQRDKQLVMGNQNANCMYWANDHYEKVACNEEARGRLILPLNEEKLKNFKKITKEDTITEKSVGVIFCISVEGKPEYYTAGGNHPIYITRNLKLLSPYMFKNHLRKNETPGSDSSDEQNMKVINNK